MWRAAAFTLILAFSLDLAVLVEEAVADAGHLLNEAVAETGGEGVVAGDTAIGGGEDEAAPGLLAIQIGGLDGDGDVLIGRLLVPGRGLLEEALNHSLILLAALNDAVGGDGGSGLVHDIDDELLVLARVLHNSEELPLDGVAEIVENDATLLHHAHALGLGVVGAGNTAVDLDLLLLLLEVGADLGLLELGEAHLLDIVLLLGSLVKLLGLLLGLAIDEVDHRLNLALLGHDYSRCV